MNKNILTLHSQFYQINSVLDVIFYPYNTMHRVLLNIFGPQESRTEKNKQELHLYFH